MRTLFHFIKSSGKHKQKRTSLFEKTRELQCEYSYSETYLGAEAKVILAEGNFEVRISYSVRDGVFVKIKRNKPYKILYDYLDGVSLVLDEEDRGYAQLTENLNNLKDGSGKHFHLDVYDRLEKEVYNFLVREFNQCTSNAEISTS